MHGPLPEVSHWATLNGDASHHNRGLGGERGRDISSGLAEFRALVGHQAEVGLSWQGGLNGVALGGRAK